MTKSRWLGLGAGVVLILVAFGVALAQGGPLFSAAGTALAQTASTPTPAAQPTTAPSNQPSTAPNQQGTNTDILNAFWNALASKLGISVDTLKSDVTDAQKAAIEQAVKDGKLTRAQADRLEQNLNSNRPFAPFGFGFRGRGLGPRGNNGAPGPNTAPGQPGKGLGLHGGLSGGLNELEAVATALNMKPADVVSQLRSGKTLADLATAQKVDQAQVKQAIIDAEKAQIQRAVTDGTLTQAQADSILANLTPDKIDLTRTRGWGWGWR